MSSLRSLRHCLALGAILLYAGISTARWARRAVHWPAHVGVDEVSLYERRFDQLRRALPPTGVVGYVGYPDPLAPPSDSVPSPALLHFRRYLLAQYTLAPLLLVEDTTRALVVGNFAPGAEPAPPGGFESAGEFGDGLMLFRRRRP
ncbi:MAG TPA: hypothetical protein VFJ81_11175 [Gemmatimonadales bacterium]|nr:hypothetical protein [Gemmatimonadales bacterium]